MDFLRLFCPRDFVGTPATIGLRRAESISDRKIVLELKIPVVLPGAAMVFINRFKYSSAVGCYPSGLAAEHRRAYVTVAVDHINASAIATLVGAIIAVVPDYLQRHVLTEERIRDLKEATSAIREKRIEVAPKSSTPQPLMLASRDRKFSI